MEAARIREAVRLLDMYNPAIHNVDSLMETEFGRDWREHPVHSFTGVVVSEAVRLRDVTRAFLNALYHVNATSLNRNDFTLFRVLSFLLLFRTEPSPSRGRRASTSPSTHTQKPAATQHVHMLSWHRFADYLAAVDAPTFSRVFVFLRFTFDRSALEEWVTPVWARVLDRAFVAGNILARLDALTPDAERWMHEHAHAVNQRPSSRDAAKEAAPVPARHRTHTHTHSKTGAPAITAPRPRYLPLPERIPQGFVSQPIMTGSLTLDDLDEQAIARSQATRDATARKYNPERDAFKFHELADPHRTERVRSEVEAKRAEELKFEGFRARPWSRGVTHTAAANVRLNLGAILREDAILKARQAQDTATIEAYEMERHDAKTLETWRQRKEAEDEAAAAAAIRQRKLEMAEAARDAAKSAAAAAKRRARSATRMREVSKEVLHQREEQAEIERQKHAKVVAQVRAFESTGPAHAVAALVKDKHAIVAEVREESKRLEAARAEERQKEAVERADVIRRIRALERVPRASVRLHDPTTTASSLFGAGGGIFLEEMSLVELRERLAALKAQREQDVEDAHARIVRAKREATEVVRAKLEHISDYRHTARQANAQRRVERIAAEESKKLEAAERHDDEALAVAERLDARRTARTEELRRLAEERELVAKKNMFLGAAKSAIEERRLEQLLLGAQNRAQREHDHELAIRREAARMQELDQRAAAAAAAEAEASARVAAHQHAEAVKAAARDAKQFAAAELTSKERAFIAATVRADALRDMRGDAFPAEAHAVAHARDTARTRWGGEPHASLHSRTLSARMNVLGTSSATRALRKSLELAAARS